MDLNPAPRSLAFERLEAKRLPTSLLLMLAPLGDTWHADSETLLAERGVDTADHWCHPHSAAELIRFVEEQTPKRGNAGRPLATPSTDQCEEADRMMKLQDSNLRAAVIVESLDLHRD